MRFGYSSILKGQYSIKIIQLEQLYQNNFYWGILRIACNFCLDGFFSLNIGSLYFWHTGIKIQSKSRDLQMNTQCKKKKKAYGYVHNYWLLKLNENFTCFGINSSGFTLTPVTGQELSTLLKSVIHSYKIAWVQINSGHYIFLFMHAASNGNGSVNLKALLSSQGVILCRSLDAE